MPKSYRIRTEIGTNKVLPIKLDQDYDTLDVLSMSIFPNDVYTRNCADFGVVCGRVFCNKGLGLVNARVSIFIPIQEEDESNPIISTLYPYKSFSDFNEDGYKYNLLPYTKSYSGHVPVGTFPDRIDALTNPSVVEVYDKYYKFTAKTNDSGDFMIFGVPIGQYELFMQIDLSDIGEFSLSPQDLIRMGRAVESQVNGTKFKFSENYSELPQIVTLTKTIQVAPFYGQEGICQHYIVRADFDLTTEASIELKPTAVFMGSLISATNKKKLKKDCKVPSKQGWLCDMITGPGQIECIRQTIFTDEDGRPILEEHRLENDGKLIDENGAWVVELPMNLDYVYTDEFGNRVISLDGSAGVPIKSRYRFKIKWQQSTSLREENRRGYFLVPNIKEWGWDQTAAQVAASNTPNYDPINTSPSSGGFFVLNDSSTSYNVSASANNYYVITGSENVSEWEVLLNGVVRRDLHDTIPMPLLAGNVVTIIYTLIDDNTNGKLFRDVYNKSQFQLQSSYAFSLSWFDYGTSEMIQEAVDCEDRFFEFQYNKVYTVSQLIDRYSSSFVPQKSIQIKYVNDDKCEGEKNPFPVNDAYYRYDILFILFGFIIGLFKFIFIPLTIILHVLALLWPILLAIIIVFIVVLNIIIAICTIINLIISAISAFFGGEGLGSCPEFIPINFDQLRINPFKNIQLPLFLYTEDGCTRCKCNISDLDLDAENNSIAVALIENAETYNEINVSNLANLTTFSEFSGFTLSFSSPANSNHRLGGSCGTLVEDELTNGTGNESSRNGNQTRELITQILQTGWNSDEKLNWIRLPIFQGNDEYFNLQRFSLGLTLAERLNLFNTKAKYFDNVTDFWGAGNPNNKNESISPGNIGWNQIKLTWNPTNNNPDTKYHFDNVLVLVYDSGDFNQGDILSFQDPSESLDTNVNETLGVFTKHLTQTVNYANPNFGGPPTSTTTYTMPIAGPSSVTGTTCYPMDIEYFQVIKTISYNDYISNTNLIAGIPANSNPNRTYQNIISRNPSQPSYDSIFSLPYRFLRSNIGQFRYWGACNGCDASSNTSPAGHYLSPYVSTDGLSNANRTYIRTANNGTDCYRRCTDLVGYTHSHMDDWGSIDTSNLRIMFLQRGVDPNSQTIPIKYDLRRLFGSPTSWSSEARKAGINTQQFTSAFYNEYIEFTAPAMKMNIPIQGSSVTWNPKGLTLPYHEFFTTNDPSDIPFQSLPLFYESYNFEYINNIESPFYSFNTKMPTFYSALSKYSKFLHGQWNSGTTVDSGLINRVLENFGGQAVTGLYEGITCVSPSNNAFNKNLIREVRFADTYTCYMNSTYSSDQSYPFSIVAGATVHPSYNPGPWDGDGQGQALVTAIQCNSQFANDTSYANAFRCYEGAASCYGSSDNIPNGYSNGGTGRYCNIYCEAKNYNLVYHSLRLNTETNDISGYYGREYVEGGSVFLGELTTYLDYSASVFRGCVVGFGGQDFGSPYWYYESGPPNSNEFAATYQGLLQGYGTDFMRQRDHFFSDNGAIYFSPVYAGFKTGVPVDPAGYNASTWHIDPNHTIQITNKSYSVFRTDRLPSSTQVSNNGYGNTMLLHQNAGFGIFKFTGCEIEQTGGGDVVTEPVSVEVNIDNIPGGADGPYATVLESLTDCSKAVDLNSYYISGGNPQIHDAPDWSERPAVGADFLWFERGRGCYNLVSKPFVSLFNTDASWGGVEKKYSDIRSVVEWTQRLKLTFALCFDIFSQTFSNNWINGTLYAFPFAAPTFFDDDNEPFREYCTDTIFYNRQIKNYFYRSSPYNENIGEFTGKLNYDLTDASVNKYGNLRNLLFPTTIFDMGPKNEFIQELVNSDDYDGYIVNKVPISSSQDNSGILNLFVLSRFVNASFWQLLFPVGNTDDNGNEQGSDDPSIGALFKNSRWQNGELFAAGFLPGLIDADFSQMISINSEFGVPEYTAENYGNDTIYFGTDNTGIPVFGLFYRTEQQDRDYLSPRRTIWNPNADAFPLDLSAITSINTFTQEVPFYQWNIRSFIGQGANSNVIFGQQSNNFITNGSSGEFFSSRYQALDRANPSSQYYTPSSTFGTLQYYNGIILNYDSSGNPTETLPTPQRSNYTFGAPFHFYFGLIQGGSAMDVFIGKYVDTIIVNE